MSRHLEKIVLGSSFALVLLASGATRASEAVPLYALIVGGGPDQNSNAAQIEGHVRFVGGMLPPAAKHIVLFADGNADSATVSYTNISEIAEAKRAMAVLLPNSNFEAPTLTRAPRLGIQLDGPSRLRPLHRALTRLALEVSGKPAPLLLFFAGHGTQNAEREQDTQCDMWRGEELKVRDLAAEVAPLPLDAPIVLVMVQCFSGAFSDVLFRDGNPKGALIPQDMAGFFSARKDRYASGCSWETKETDYQDFSSYFFGAICGHDRFAHAVGGADFDGDGAVSLHEAFCYALIHDKSDDTPVCTSDVFLRRFSQLSDAKIYGTPYGKIWEAATAAQRAALDALSQQLGLAGEQRAFAAYDRLKFSDPVARLPQTKSANDAAQRLNTLRQTTLESLFKNWPGLRWRHSREFREAADGATGELGKNKQLCRDLLEAMETRLETEGAEDNEEAALMRFSSLCESIVRAQDLREHGKEEIKTRFARLWKIEQSVLPAAH